MNADLAIYAANGCPVYSVTKTFTKGNLKGITITEESVAEMKVGKTYTGIGSGAYRIDACTRIA